MYTTVEASKETNLKPDTFRQRAKTIGLVPFKKNNMFMWSDRQIDTIQKWKRIRKTNYFKFSKKNISIVDFYLTHRNNTQVEISESMGLTVSRVNKVLTDFLNTGYVVVESKINVDNFYE